MSKYQPLTERLSHQSEPDWRATFSEIEAVLGFPLPRGARVGKVWWANTGAQPHQRAWTAVGWEVSEVAEGIVTFRRTAAATAASDEPAILKRLELSPTWGMAVIAGGVAVVAGLGALALRSVMRRRT